MLASLKGGCVDLAQDHSTGIATIRLNNPERMNSLSGEPHQPQLAGIYVLYQHELIGVLNMKRSVQV